LHVPFGVEKCSRQMSVRSAIEWLQRSLTGAGLWWGVAVSAVLFFASLALAVTIVISWPPDHFKLVDPPPFWAHRHPVVRAVGYVAKNLAGVLLILLGIVMAVPGVPGQGFLTIIIGITLLNFPRKRRLERRLIGRPSILRNINRLRARFHHPPLELD
jgi:hypothetical protein